VFKVTLLPDAETSFKKIDKSLQKRISQKIDWLAAHADKIVHHPLISLPVFEEVKLIKEPKRIKRQLVFPNFLFSLLATRTKLMRSAKSKAN